MKKQVINKNEEGMCIVILGNEHYGILVKGISKCHPDDTYDPVLGEKIANSRAWIKYYEKLKKVLSNELECLEELRDYFTNSIEELKITKENAYNKYDEILADYEETLKNL